MVSSSISEISTAALITGMGDLRCGGTLVGRLWMLIIATLRKKTVKI
jgi:hypothetical protein